MPIPFLNLGAQYQNIRKEIDPAIQEVLEASTFALGPAVERFEKNFARYCGVRHCIGVGSGTSALSLLMQAHGIGPGDEVITAANSFFASAEAISLIGATPILVDVREETANMNPTLLEEKITEKTKAILPVHLYGQPAEMDEILTIAKNHDLIVLEDAAQAHGAKLNGKYAGSLAHGAAFSFYPGKNLGAYGEGGAVTTDDDDIAKRIRMLREHGMSQKYHHDVVGWNERLDGIQGAVLDVKLKFLDEWNTKRRKHAKLYHSLLKGVGGIRCIDVLEKNESVYHLFVIRTAKRDALQQHLNRHNIATGIHYPIPIHRQSAYADRGWKEGDFPVSEKLAKEILSLPMYAELSDDQINEVCTAVKEFFA